MPFRNILLYLSLNLQQKQILIKKLLPLGEVEIFIGIGSLNKQVRVCLECLSYWSLSTLLGVDLVYECHVVCISCEKEIN